VKSAAAALAVAAVAAVEQMASLPEYVGGQSSVPESVLTVRVLMLTKAAVAAAVAAEVPSWPIWQKYLVRSLEEPAAVAE